MSGFHAPACKGCGKQKHEDNGTWWHLSNYKGFYGTYCPACYDRISALDTAAALVAHTLEGTRK